MDLIECAALDFRGGPAIRLVQVLGKPAPGLIRPRAGAGW
jgi:hypothetical protein